MKKSILITAILLLTFFARSIQASNLYFGGAFGYSESAVENMEGAPQIKAFFRAKTKIF